MRKIYLCVCMAALLFSCRNSNSIPDVSAIKIDISTKHFEKDLFKTDTSNFNAKLDQLEAGYASFGENFVYTILSADPKWSADSIADYVKQFATDKLYRSVYDSSQLLFKDFSPYENEIRKGLQFIKYYFPEYKAPKNIVTYIGPLDGYGDILADDAIIVGLQHHMGKNYSLYKTPLVQETYPDYICNRFEPDYIAVNAMKNIVLDMFPENMEDKPLVQQMVEKGKRLYMLSKILPYTEPYKLIGYTKDQLEGAFKREREIWSLFVQNNLLQTIENNIIKNYIGEGPKTQELGEDSPGNIGSFAGWQIVKKYADKNPSVTLKQLMATDPETIFQEAKYKP